jgi:hypothetical protein
MGAVGCSRRSSRLDPKFWLEVQWPDEIDTSQNRYCTKLGDEPDPRDLMRPFPVESMRMWPISTRVNKPENNDPSIVEPVEFTPSAA